MADVPSDPKANPNDPEREEFATALKELEAVLMRIPGLEGLVRDVRELRAVFIHRRLPRVAVLGRRGAGKSSLANALLGAELFKVGAVEDTTRAPAWMELQKEGRALRWMDTPGLRAGTYDARRGQLIEAFTEERPDAVLFLVRATQVDAGIDEDLIEVRALLDEVAKRSGVRPPLLTIITRVDELPPVSAKIPPFDGEKRTHINTAVEVLKKHLARHAIDSKAVIPVGAYQRFFKDGGIAVDWRWNLEALAVALFDVLPSDAQAEAARALEHARGLRRKVAMKVVRSATSLSFFLGTTPVPVADIAVLAPLQTLMVTAVMFIAGRKPDRRAVGEWFTSLGVNIGTGFALRETARGLIKLLPGWGGAVAGAVAATGTWALGLSSVRYFIDGAGIDEARLLFEKARREGVPSEAEDGPAIPRSAIAGEPSATDKEDSKRS